MGPGLPRPGRGISIVAVDALLALVALLRLQRGFGLRHRRVGVGAEGRAEDAARHSGAHRISRIRMRPMTLFERGRGDGSVSLASLFNGEAPAPVLNSGAGVREALDDLIEKNRGEL